MSRHRQGYHKEYYRKNKEHILKMNKEWRDNNKALEKEINRRKHQAAKDGYHNVYLLEDYNYVGCTDNLPHRFRQHHAEFGRDCKNYKILFQSVDRDEALRVESEYHEQGYDGKHAYNSYQ